MTDYTQFGADQAARANLLQSIERDISNAQYIGLAEKTPILVSASLIERLADGVMSLAIARDAEDPVERALATLTAGAPNKALLLMTRTLKQIDAGAPHLSAHPVVEFFKPHLLNASNNPQASLHLRADGFKALLSTPNVIGQNDQAGLMSAALDLLVKNEAQPNMMADERSGLCIAVINAAAVTGHNELYQQAVSKWQSVLEGMTPQKSIQQARLEHFVVPTEELEQICVRFNPNQLVEAPQPEQAFVVVVPAAQERHLNA